MGKIKGVTVGHCEVCGEDTGIDSPKVCYGCVKNQERIAAMRFQVTIKYEFVGSDTRAAQDLDVKGNYEWIVHAGRPCRFGGPTGRQVLLSGYAETLAEADADARVAVEGLCHEPVIAPADGSLPVPF